MFRKLGLIGIFVLTVACMQLSAIGLGEIKLNSGLNQPLDAQIVLLSPEGMSEYEVSAALASLNEFDKAGLDYFGFLRDIRFKTTRSDSGLLVVELSTREPIKEPFLNFLVELNWPRGRMLREYTLLLDPPVFSESRSTTVQAPQQTTPSTTSGASQPQPSRSSPRPSQSAPAITGNTYGPINEAETLWSIASRVRPDNASIHQTLVALYRNNPSAFVNNDINLLKQGATLTIPDAQSITSTPRRAALQDMVARLRGSSDTVLDTTGRSTRTPSSSRQGDRLRLASPTTGNNGNGSGTGGDAQVQELRSELATTKEAAATLEAENAELRKKLQDALSSLEQRDSVTSVDSDVGAALANSDQVFADEGTNEQAVSDTQSSSETSPEDINFTEDSASVSSVEEAISDDTATDDTASDSTATTTPAESNRSSRNSVNIPQVQTAWYESPMVMYGGAALLVVLLAAFAVFYRMRQKMNDEDFQDDLVLSAQGNSFEADDTLDLSAGGDDLLDDLDSDEVFEEEGDTEADALGEADIYIAYGKYDQAEKLLSDAIEADPERKDLKLKLLECYAEMQEKEKFTATEKKYENSFFGDSEAASQIAQLKADAWPDESGSDDDFELPSTEEIFGEDSSDALDADDDFSLDDLDTEISDDLEDSLANDDLSDAADEFETDDMDFDIDDKVSEESKQLEDDDFSLDDELLSLDDSGESPAVELDDTADLSGQTEESLDLDLDNDISLDDDVALGDDLSDDFDLGDDDFSDDEFDGADESSTKLDLARAYIDMGDADGAKEILNEVIEEGDDAHKKEAQDLLAKL